MKVVIGTIGEWFTHPMVTQFTVLIVVTIATRLLVHTLRRSLTNKVQDASARYHVQKSINMGGYLLLVFVAAIIFKDRLGGLTVAFGVAGAGVAFALQEVIVSVAGWASISFGNVYRPGDRVQMGGIKGDVIDVSILRTTLMELGEWVQADQYNGRIVRVPNSFVFKEPLFNYSGDFPFLWDEIKLPIKYGSDHNLARSIMESVAMDIVGADSADATTAWKSLIRKYLLEDTPVNPRVTLALNDNWIEFTIRYVVDYRKRRTTKDALFSRLLEDIQATGGKVGFASATFHLVEAPVFEVHMRGADTPP